MVVTLEALAAGRINVRRSRPVDARC